MGLNNVFVRARIAMFALILAEMNHEIQKTGQRD